MCFIATAGFGSQDAWAVLVLRSFRERFLRGNLPGEILLGLYERLSPGPARYIKEHRWARITVRILLLPLVGYALFMIKTALHTKVIICILLVGGIVLTYILKKAHERKKEEISFS
jgi:hypothetical protein